MNGKKFVLKRRREMVTVVELMQFIAKAPPAPGNESFIEGIGVWLDTFVEDPNPANVEYEIHAA